VQVLKDDWTPLFNSLKERTGPQGRKRLLFQMIGDVYDLTVKTFGANGENRPAHWNKLKPKYAREYHGGDRTPTLILTGKMLASFRHTVGENKATLTNTVPYADAHQFGEEFRGLPARPYYPVTPDGESLTTFALERQREILNAHFSV